MFQEEDEVRRRGQFSRRGLVVGAVQLGVLGAIAGRLHHLQVVDGRRYAPLADDNRIDVRMLAPVRGRIFDRTGEALATNREGYRAVIVPSLAGDVAAVARRFAALVALDESRIERIVERSRRQPANVPITLAGDLTFEQIAEINLFSPQLPGVRTEPESRRVYHHGATVGHVVGHVGALERLALDDDPVLRLAGMRTGKAGVELGMEHLLRGIGGHIRQEVDARGRIVRELEEKPAEHGHDIVLSLHRRLQEKVVARMAGERQAALVAIDVETGEVPVMVSRPLIDNAVLAGADAGQELRRLQRGGGHPMVNRAIRGLYPPGSTFKMAVALAALEAGVISLKERIACDGRFVYADQTYRRWKRQGHDGCDLHKALRESCDVYFYEVARRTGIEAIARMARRLGLGQVYDCGIALQKPGIVPDPAWKQARFGRSWLGGETILAGVGQGYVATTPLQLAVMTARLASGHALEPRLVRADPRVSPPPPPLGIRPEWLEAIRRAMFAVVNEESGTGANGRIEEGTHRLAGKTGTSQVSRASSERGHSELAWHERDHALFVAFAPFARPRFAVAAVLEHAGSGGREAAPLVRDVMADLLAAEPTARSAEPPPPGEGRRG